MKTEILNILVQMVRNIEDANHNFKGGGLHGEDFMKYTTARVNAQIDAAEAIERLYVDRIAAIAEKAENMQKGCCAKAS